MISRRAFAALGVLLATSSVTIGSASSAQAVETWTITSLTLDNVITTDVNAYSGDDGGFIAPMKKRVVYNADGAGYTYDLGNFDPVAGNDAAYDNPNISFASDLKSNVAYEVVAGTVSSGVLDRIVSLDQDGNEDQTILLSQTIDLNSNSWFLMSGFGYLALWDYSYGYFYTIDPDGTVNAVDMSANQKGYYDVVPNSSQGETSDYFMAGGVVQFDGTDYWYTGLDQYQSISEFNITGPSYQNVLLINTDSAGDSDTFTVSTCSNKLYMHTEDDMTSFFGQPLNGAAEFVVVADATFSSAGDCTIPDSPASSELPATGVNAGPGLAFAGILTCLGVAAVVGRRRVVASK